MEDRQIVLIYGAKVEIQVYYWKDIGKWDNNLSPISK